MNRTELAQVRQSGKISFMITLTDLSTTIYEAKVNGVDVLLTFKHSPESANGILCTLEQSGQFAAKRLEDGTINTQYLTPRRAAIALVPVAEHKVQNSGSVRGNDASDPSRGLHFWGHGVASDWARQCTPARLPMS